MSKVVGVTVGSPLSKEKIIELINEHGGKGLTENEVNAKVSEAKEKLIGTLEDTVDANTIRGAKAYAKEQYEKANEYTVDKVKNVKKELIGFSVDEETANTINGAKKYAKKLFDNYDASEAVEAALTEAKESGEFNGADGKDGAAGADGQDGENGLSAYQIWLQQGNTGSEADFLESLKGADGASGKDGAKGSDGEDGKDGTSVTVSSVTESTADGGENVVTFSNGQTLKVKNGSKGSKGEKGEQGDKGDPGEKGEQGEKGDAYTLTEADKQEIVASVIETLGGNPIFGYVDENNNIIVQGNLADGTYSVKYEMENGTTVDIGNLVLDTNVYYSITNNITNCTSNNGATQVVEGESYFATITANDGYELKNVSVTMGGSVVSVSGGVISIASVTGDIVITAVAEETASYDGYDVFADFGYVDDSRLGSSSIYNGTASGYVLTGAIPLTDIAGKTITVWSKDLDYTGGKVVWAIMSNDTMSASYVVKGITSDSSVWQDIQLTYNAPDANGIASFTMNIPSEYASNYLRISGYGTGTTSQITIDREIAV